MSSPLHEAARSGSVESLVAALLLHGSCGAHSVDDRNAAGCTALHVAAREGRAACVASLLSAGARVDATDKTCSTPLLAACSRSRPGAVAALLERGANPRAADYRGDTALHALLRGFAAETDRGAYEDTLVCLQLLLLHGADPCAANEEGETPFAAAVHRRCAAAAAAFAAFGSPLPPRDHLPGAAGEAPRVIPGLWAHALGIAERNLALLRGGLGATVADVEARVAAATASSSSNAGFDRDHGPLAQLRLMRCTGPPPADGDAFVLTDGSAATTAAPPPPLLFLERAAWAVAVRRCAEKAVVEAAERSICLLQQWQRCSSAAAAASSAGAASSSALAHQRHHRARDKLALAAAAGVAKWSDELPRFLQQARLAEQEALAVLRSALPRAEEVVAELSWRADAASQAEEVVGVGGTGGQQQQQQPGPRGLLRALLPPS